MFSPTNDNAISRLALEFKFVWLSGDIKRTGHLQMPNHLGLLNRPIHRHSFAASGAQNFGPLGVSPYTLCKLPRAVRSRSGLNGLADNLH